MDATSSRNALRTAATTPAVEHTGVVGQRDSNALSSSGRSNAASLMGVDRVQRSNDLYSITAAGFGGHRRRQPNAPTSGVELSAVLDSPFSRYY